ncbi:peptidoglycan recognition family protein [Cohnella sp.]|uniref:peptidoglycan recognition protein family protein n=1 Tax=Cohnella sp. TaxID=1883426 RepID=UPI003568B0A7
MAKHAAFHRYTLPEFLAVLDNYVNKVRFNGIHVHGTWKPTIADYRKASNKESLIQAMWRFHTATRKFSDIAQHATIDPNGYIWEGRSLLNPPASAYNHNDSDRDGVHPFMFEMIGNFDAGAEVLKGAQLHTTLGLCRGIMERWSLSTSNIHFHREMQSGKSCPGSGIDKAKFITQVTSYAPAVLEASATSSPSPIEAVKPPSPSEPTKSALTTKDANAIIKLYLQPAWAAAQSKEEKDEIHRIANEIRQAAGLKPE